MNICGYVGLLFISAWDLDWAEQMAGISAVQPLVVESHTAYFILWWICCDQCHMAVFQGDDMVSKCRAQVCFQCRFRKHMWNVNFV